MNNRNQRKRTIDASGRSDPKRQTTQPDLTDRDVQLIRKLMVKENAMRVINLGLHKNLQYWETFLHGNHSQKVKDLVRAHISSASPSRTGTGRGTGSSGSRFYHKNTRTS